MLSILDEVKPSSAYTVDLFSMANILRVIILKSIQINDSLYSNSNELLDGEWQYTHTSEGILPKVIIVFLAG
jgi:hypothetical protein